MTASRGIGDGWPAAGPSSLKPSSPVPSSASCRAATLCRCWRMVSGLVVSATGRTSLSKAAVMPKEIRDAQRLSRYSSSGAVCSLHRQAAHYARLGVLLATTTLYGEAASRNLAPIADRLLELLLQ